MQIQQYIQKQILIENLDWEKITLFSIYSLSVLIPLVIGHPQLLVGSMINFLITYSTLKYGVKKTIPVLILPSLTAYLTGLLFGGATTFLLYLLPAISFSNFLFSIQISRKTKFSYITAVISKGTFLLVIYFLFNRYLGLPNIFLASSYLQYTTALGGLVMGVGLYKVTK